MDFGLAEILSYSILPAALIGLFRFKKVLNTYRPFILFTWLALINEVVSAVVAKRFQTNAVNSNIYVLIEFVILIMLFKRWGSGRKQNINFKLLLVLLIGVWVADNLIFHPITQFNSLYRVCYSFVLVFMSVDEINRHLVKERKTVWKNARFLICITMLSYYTYKTIFEIFFVVNLQASVNFQNNLFTILIYVNLFANLMYALASLWMPTRQTFTLPN
jgi:hypothetical protein